MPSLLTIIALVLFEATLEGIVLSPTAMTRRSAAVLPYPLDLANCVSPHVWSRWSVPATCPSTTLCRVMFIAWHLIPGPLPFLHAILKRCEWPGDEAACSVLSCRWYCVYQMVSQHDVQCHSVVGYLPYGGEVLGHALTGLLLSLVKLISFHYGRRFGVEVRPYSLPNLLKGKNVWLAW